VVSGASRLGCKLRSIKFKLKNWIYERNSVLMVLNYFIYVFNKLVNIPDRNQ